MKALTSAARGGDIKAVLSLIEQADCDVNVVGDYSFTALMWAVRKVKTETDVYGQIIDVLLKHRKIDVNLNCTYKNEERTALHIACGWNPGAPIV